MRFEVPVVHEDIEAGALLEPFVGLDASVAVEVGREVAVTHDDGIGEAVVEGLQELAQAATLSLGAGVTGPPVHIESAFVADADAVLVVVLAVGTYLLQRTSHMHAPVAREVIMVSDVAPAPPQVIGPALFEAVTLPGLRGRAVNDD